MEDTRQRSSRYAEKKKGTCNKFYEVRVEEEEAGGEAKVTFVYGRIGTAGREIVDGFAYCFDHGQVQANEQFEKKLAKGYVEATAMQAIASAVETLEERKTNGYEPVELEIPHFNSASRERWIKLCKKWNAKLNLVRGSATDLGGCEYREQIRGVVNGYSREWSRIKTSKAHGHLYGNRAAELAYQTFVLLLRDNTRRHAGTS